MAKDVIEKDVLNSGDAITITNGYLFPLSAYKNSDSSIRFGIPMTKEIKQVGWKNITVEASGNNANFTIIFLDGTTVTVSQSEISTFSTAWYPELGIGCQMAVTTNKFANKSLICEVRLPDTFVLHL